jgi:hypothetical protein
MNTPIVGGAAALLLVWLWFSRRRAPQLLRSTDASAIAALNREQIAALSLDAPSPAPPGIPAGGEEPMPPVPPVVFPAPGDGGARARLLRQWLHAYAAVPETRLEVMRLARVWGHPATLPLLHLGLRAPDPAVVQEAALAMARFRGHRLAGSPQLRQSTLPRNVARTR